MCWRLCLYVVIPLVSLRKLLHIVYACRRGGQGDAEGGVARLLTVPSVCWYYWPALKSHQGLARLYASSSTEGDGRRYACKEPP